MRDIWALFETREEKKERKKLEEKEEIDNRLIEDKIIRDTRKLFEQKEEDCYKPKRVNNFWNNN